MITHKRCKYGVYTLALIFLVKSKHNFSASMVNSQDHLFLIEFVIFGDPQLGDIQFLKWKRGTP